MNNEPQQVVYLHLDDIIPNRFQPREVFDERALKELAVSIKEHGVIQPITVRKINNNKYEIIAGERRYKATALAGLTTIPAIIRNLDDKEAAKVALLENLQRKNLNPIEEARTYQKIIELDEMTQEELAKTMGKSQSAVANKIRLLALPDEVQKALLNEEISERHARALLNLGNQEEQNDMLKRITKEKMTVRQLENEIKGINMPKQDTIKDENDLNSIINPTAVPIQNNVNSSFLMSPSPISADQNKQDNIINYGEIDDNEENEEIDENQNLMSSISQEPIDINKLKSNTEDISSISDNKKESNNGDLDSLLNLKAPEKNKIITPAEEAIRESENKNYENKADYFQAPDLMSITLPNATQSAQLTDSYNNTEKNSNDLNSLLDFATNKKELGKDNKNKLVDINQTLFQKPIEKEIKNTNQKSNKSLGVALMSEVYNNNKDNNNEQYNIQQMVNEIRKTLSDLEQHGAKIDTDEMNFENEYQILIKIDKNSNY